MRNHDNKLSQLVLDSINGQTLNLGNSTTVDGTINGISASANGVVINAMVGKSVSLEVSGNPYLVVDTTTFTITDGVNMVVGSASGLKIGTAPTQKLALFNATPVVQPATTGTATGFTAGAGTAVNDQSTFTGGTGSKAYCISDIVLALKQLGIMAAA